MESIHQEMYAALLDSYVKDRREKDRLFNAHAQVSALITITMTTATAIISMFSMLYNVCSATCFAEPCSC
jgi:hypothetical protein